MVVYHSNQIFYQIFGKFDKRHYFNNYIRFGK